MLTPWSIYPTDEFGNPMLPGMYQGVPMGRNPASLPPVAKGSGLRNEEESKKNESEKSSLSKPSFSDPNDMESTVRSIYGLAPIQSQLQGQEQLKNLLAMEMTRQHPQLDLSPLADLVNFETHGQYKSTYKAPDNAAIRNKMLLMNDKVQDDQRDLTKNIFQAVNSFKGNDTMMKMLEMASMGKNIAQDPNMVRNPIIAPQASFEKEVRQTLDKDIGQKAQDQANILNGVEGALKSGDYAQLKANLGPLARGVLGDKGVIRQEEIQRLLPANYQGDVAGFLSYFNKTPSSQIDPEFTKSLQTIVDRARANAATKYGQALQNQHNVYKASQFYTPNTESVFNSYGQHLNTLFPKSAPEPSIKDLILQKLMQNQGGK